MHDGTKIEIDSKLSVVRSFVLPKRIFTFGNNKEGKSPFFGLKNHAPFQSVRDSTRVVFIYQDGDHEKSQDLFRALRGDTYTTFPGMEQMFRVPFGKQNVSGIEISGFGNEEIQRMCRSLKIKIMKWCLRVKLAQNWDRFGELLRSTDEKPIVEESRKDDFWGAKRLENGTLVGMNVLGRLLMELRLELTSPVSECLRSVPVPDIPDFLLLGQPIDPIDDRPTLTEPSREASGMHISPIGSKNTNQLNGKGAKSAVESNMPQRSWPQSTEADVTANSGVHLAGLKVTDELHYIFRQKTVSDIGIDGEIEIRKQDKSNGRLVAVQIKTGESYLRERTENGFVFRGSMAHLRYWLSYSVPVVVVLGDLRTKTCWWQLVDLQKIHFHEASWSMEVPFAQKLDSSAIDPIRSISMRFQKKDIVDVLFKSWLLESHYYELTLADILEQPRDYHWLRFLGRQPGQFVMADYVMADLKSFDSMQLNEMVHWAEYNHRQFTYERFLLALISETSQAFPINYKPTVTEPRLIVELVPLVLKLDDGPQLSEIGANGRSITSYFDHQTWDGWGQEVPQQRIEISGTGPGLVARSDAEHDVSASHPSDRK